MDAWTKDKNAAVIAYFVAGWTTRPPLRKILSIVRTSDAVELALTRHGDTFADISQLPARITGYRCCKSNKNAVWRRVGLAKLMHHDVDVQQDGGGRAADPLSLEALLPALLTVLLAHDLLPLRLLSLPK